MFTLFSRQLSRRQGLVAVWVAWGVLTLASINIPLRSTRNIFLVLTIAPALLGLAGVCFHRRRLFLASVVTSAVIVVVIAANSIRLVPRGTVLISEHSDYAPTRRRLSAGVHLALPFQKFREVSGEPRFGFDTIQATLRGGGSAEVIIAYEYEIDTTRYGRSPMELPENLPSVIRGDLEALRELYRPSNYILVEPSFEARTAAREILRRALILRSMGVIDEISERYIAFTLRQALQNELYARRGVYFRRIEVFPVDRRMQSA